MGQLLMQEDLSLVRQCGGEDCTIIFLDRTKSHRRRWCSMAACGNRAKVAAFRARSAG
jgi:predicted RNA-binding Zn ribbon-like protein